MKKRTLILAFLLVSTILSYAVLADNVPGLDDAPLVGEIQQGQETYGNLSRGEIQTEYLEKEWTDWFRNSKYGSFIYKLDPIFHFLFGMDFSISWRFVAGFLVWVIMMSFYYPIFRMMFNSQISSVGAALALSALTSNLLTPTILDGFAKLIKNIWHNLILIIALFVMIFMVERAMKLLTAWWKKRRQEKRLQKVEKATSDENPDLSNVRQTLEQAKGVKAGYEQEINSPDRPFSD